MKETQDWVEECPNKMGLLGATSIGVGGMVGGGIFAVLGLAASLGKGGTFLSFLIAGITALLTAYSFSKLSLHHMSDGGMTTFLTEGFGNNWFSVALNMMSLLSYVVMLSLYSAAFGFYAMTFVAPPYQKMLFHIAVCFAIIAPAFLNILESHHFGRALFWIVAAKVAILIFFIFIGFVEFQPHRIAASNWPGFISLVEAGMLIFVAYEGFELIANTSEEIKRPQKNIPRAFFLAVGFVIVLYILVSLCTVGSLSVAAIQKAEEYVLAEAAKPALGQAGFVLISVAALLSTFSAVKSTLYGTSRTSARIANTNQMPRIIGLRHKGRPLVSLFILTVFSLIVANLVNLRQISIMGSAGFLTLFTFVNLVNAIHHKKTGSMLWLTIVAIICCFFSLFILLFHGGKIMPKDLIPVGCLYAFSFLYGIFYCLFRPKTPKEKF